MSEITIENVDAQLVAGMTRTGSYKIIAEMLPDLYVYVMSNGAELTGPPVFVCRETSQEAAMKANQNGTARVEVCAPIAGAITESEAVKVYELPGGKMAKVVHQGPYEHCETTYKKLFDWVVENGHQINGPIREVYLNDPRVVSPEDILTEIYAPIG